MPFFSSLFKLTLINIIYQKWLIARNEWKSNAFHQSIACYTLRRRSRCWRCAHQTDVFFISSLWGLDVSSSFLCSSRARLQVQHLSDDEEEEDDSRCSINKARKLQRTIIFKNLLRDPDAGSFEFTRFLTFFCILCAVRDFILKSWNL